MGFIVTEYTLISKLLFLSLENPKTNFLSRMNECYAGEGTKYIKCKYFFIWLLDLPTIFQDGVEYVNKNSENKNLNCFFQLEKDGYL